jgi:NAD(P)-dependent dehydrogenase (short-subunit alcohol dehydrogenase family)
MPKVMLVTGASRGIGAATARLAGRRGYAVVVNYLGRRDAADAVVADIEKAGSRALAVQADVADESAVKALFATIDKAFGPLDVLVNNAGISQRLARPEEISKARLERMFSVNVFGTILCAGEAVRRMSHRHGGKGGIIVNISSIAAYHGGPNDNIDYAATKGAVDSLTWGLAKQVAAKGIRVNAVRPGMTYSDIHASVGEPDRVDRVAPTIPLGRGGKAEEIAEAVLWLCSDAATYCTGTIIDVHGGRSL